MPYPSDAEQMQLDRDQINRLDRIIEANHRQIAYEQRRTLAVETERNTLTDEIVTLRECAAQLVMAYARGEANGGSMDWMDVDDAHAHALRWLEAISNGN